MTRKIKLIMTLAVLALIAIIALQYRNLQNTKAKMVRFEQNSKALLSDIERWQVDSTTMATNVKALRLTINELERFRCEDAIKIEALGVKVKDLEAVAKHQLEINAHIKVPVTDTVIIRDSVQIITKSIDLKTKHICLQGIVDKDSFHGEIKLPVTLRQAIWIEYKRYWLFWKKPIAINQTITSDNPHVKIRYSEYIKIQK